MPFQKKEKSVDGDISGLKYHKQMLKQIVRDTTLSPNRRLFAEMVLMWLSATGRQKAVIESLLLGTNFSRFVDSRGLSITDREDGRDGDRSVQSQEADNNVLNVISMIERGNAAV